jgi:hypothetical protein
MIETPSVQSPANRSAAPGRSPIPLKDCISLGVASRIARASEETIRRWGQKGLFMCFKVGGRWWVHRDDFYAYL